MTQAELLEAARAKLGSDVAVARKIGLSPQHYNQIKHGSRFLGDYEAGVLSELLGLPPLKTIVALKIERAKNIEEEAWWRGKWRGLAAGVLLGLIGTATPSTVRATDLQVIDRNIQCAHFRRRVKSWLVALAALLPPAPAGTAARAPL